MHRRHLIPLALCLPLSLSPSGLTWAASTDAESPPDDEPPALPQYKVSVWCCSKLWRNVFRCATPSRAG